MSSDRQEIMQNRNDFYRDRYHLFIVALIVAIFLTLCLTGLVVYQIFHRPLPKFYAIAADNQHMQLTAHDEPNLLPTTLTQWASKAAVAAYTFDFVAYTKEIAQVRPYFTEAGWTDYQNSLASVIARIVKGQLIVNSVVSGPPVISNQGDIPGSGYTWRIQMPFRVTYQSAQSTSSKDYIVILTLIKIPTLQNPVGVGIDQFVMRSPQT